jgi:hypothetical protein
MIERNIPGLGEVQPSEMRAISERSCSVLRDMGPQVQWQQSYVTDDRMYCVYIADTAELVREHARRGGFPADSVKQLHSIIDPTTAEA